MKLAVIALDYDGTVARGDVMGVAVREAIAAARASGIIVLLVTGRRLDDLQRVVGDLRCVDGVVAENGAVMHLPDSSHTTQLAPSVLPGFVEELRRRAVPHQVGQCLVDADANDSPTLLAAIRALELPLVLIFNAGRVMILPQGVSKATGLQSLLETLRLSPHNTVAVGDAENDHALLRLAEVGAAVEWGSPILRASADVIVPGLGPAAAADYIRGLTSDARIPIPARARRRLRLGFTEDGREFSLGVRGRNVLVVGAARSGKSWTAGLLCEQLILHGYGVCVIDPEGDYRSLEALPRVTVAGVDDPLPSHRDLVRAFRYPDRSLVIDLSLKQHEEKIDYIREILPVINEIRAQTGFPHRILVDEAHYFLHDERALGLLDLEANGYTFVTHLASRLPAQLLAATEVMIVTRESNPIEVEALRTWCSRCTRADQARWAMLGRLATTQAMVLPVTEESGGELIPFTLGPRLTPHVRHREKYVDVPVSERQAFVFTPNRRDGVHAARTLRQFVTELEHGANFEPYLRRGDFSRWIGDVFGDAGLAADLRELEAAHRASPGPVTVSAVVEAIRARYDVGPQSSAAGTLSHPGMALRSPSVSRNCDQGALS